jgi:hypothetical protein
MKVITKINNRCGLGVRWDGNSIRADEDAEGEKSDEEHGLLGTVDAR